MKCPKCSGNMPEKVSSDGTFCVNKCKGCSGLWFDSGELAKLHGSDADIPDIAAKFKKAPATKYSCGKCSSMKLIEIPFLGDPLIQRYDVHVDYCISCHGVFLDVGELKKTTVLAEAIKKEKDTFGLFRLLEQENASGVANFFKHFFNYVVD